MNNPLGETEPKQQNIISLENGVFIHSNYGRVLVQLTPTHITVGCSTISVEAAERLLGLHKKHFKPQQLVVIQTSQL
jgi:hypothetical protein